ncbi:uncharacterized protein JN550_012377 [Neoarthrinium moseri]|uniref:uncharacterized protein n=1 Tax=Neoarthrinium moseri TaxID=1658444 RepID=UPI001FDD947E|nr:uncharacterized protein JN550_012377 [Neoarthrinium moseri]KAI1858815.1 hypothetical protein JN550_012377 [Neoarthrinium moseri]
MLGQPLVPPQSPFEQLHLGYTPGAAGRRRGWCTPLVPVRAVPPNGSGASSASTGKLMPTAPIAHEKGPPTSRVGREQPIVLLLWPATTAAGPNVRKREDGDKWPDFENQAICKAEEAHGGGPAQMAPADWAAGNESGLMIQASPASPAAQNVMDRLLGQRPGLDSTSIFQQHREQHREQQSASSPVALSRLREHISSGSDASLLSTGRNTANVNLGGGLDRPCPSLPHFVAVLGSQPSGQPVPDAPQRNPGCHPARKSQKSQKSHVPSGRLVRPLLIRFLQHLPTLQTSHVSAGQARSFSLAIAHIAHLALVASLGRTPANSCGFTLPQFPHRGPLTYSSHIYHVRLTQLEPTSPAPLLLLPPLLLRCPPGPTLGCRNPCLSSLRLRWQLSATGKAWLGYHIRCRNIFPRRLTIPWPVPNQTSVIRNFETVLGNSERTAVALSVPAEALLYSHLHAPARPCGLLALDVWGLPLREQSALQLLIRSYVLCDESV